MSDIIPIRCAVCGHNVQRTVVYRDECDASTKVVVECHGQKDTMTMPDAFLYNLGGPLTMHLVDAVAFNSKALPA